MISANVPDALAPDAFTVSTPPITTPIEVRSIVPEGLPANEILNLSNSPDVNLCQSG